MKEFNLPILEEFLTAVPTAELEPITEDVSYPVPSEKTSIVAGGGSVFVTICFRLCNRLEPYIQDKDTSSSIMIQSGYHSQTYPAYS